MPKNTPDPTKLAAVVTAEPTAIPVEQPVAAPTPQPVQEDPPVQPAADLSSTADTDGAEAPKKNEKLIQIVGDGLVVETEKDGRMNLFRQPEPEVVYNPPPPSERQMAARDAEMAAGAARVARAQQEKDNRPKPVIAPAEQKAQGRVDTVRPHGGHMGYMHENRVGGK